MDLGENIHPAAPIAPPGRTADDEPAGLAALSAIVGMTVREARRSPWGFTNQTDEVTTENGRRFAVQRFAGPLVARERVRVIAALQSRLVAAGVVAPAVVAAGPEADPPHLVTEWIDGRNGAELLVDGLDAIALGTEMGRLVGRIATADVRGLRLPSTWAEPGRLARLGYRWLAGVERDVEAEVDRRGSVDERGGGPAPLTPRWDAASAARSVAEVHRLIARVEAAFADRPRVLAHGDFAPINAIARGRTVVGIVDWEHACLADPLHDVATWGWAVWHHHRGVWGAAWPAFLETAGLELDQATAERLRIIVALRLLAAAASPAVAGDAEGRRLWIGRLIEAVDVGDRHPRLTPATDVGDRHRRPTPATDSGD